MARKKTRQKFKPKQSKDRAAEEGVLRKDAETKPKTSFGRRLLKALPLMLLALVFTFILNRSGLFTELETTILDTQMKLDMPDKDSPVVIVNISTNDLNQIFQGQSHPLNPGTMQKLIETIETGQPCVIGVDLDTSHPQFKSFKVSDKLSNVVWARESEEMPKDVNQKAVPLDVLGGQDPAFNEKSGIPFFSEDARGYRRLIGTTDGDLPSLAWAIFKEGKSRNCEGIKFPDLEENTEPLIIGYSRGEEGRGRLKIPAVDLLKLAENPNWQNNDLIKNKIVLLGGPYSGDDIHKTPLGDMSGVEITANVIESELRGGGEKRPGFFSSVLLQIFDGILIITLFQIFSWRKAVLMSLPFIIFLSLACSFFTYYSFAHWMFFAPIMIGVVLTELFDKAKDHFKKRYKHEIKEVYQEFSGQPPGENRNPAEEE